MWAPPAGFPEGAHLGVSASHAPANARARVITTSISCAPAATEALISSIRWAGD